MKSYHVGQHFRCPTCQEDSVVKARKILDGWSAVDEELVFALCGKPVVPDGESSGNEGVSSGASKTDRDSLDSRIASLFGDDADDGLRETPRFCRDCAHYLRHPFVSRCLLHDRPVEPMQDCPDYSASVSSDESSDDV